MVQEFFYYLINLSSIWLCKAVSSVTLLVCCYGLNVMDDTFSVPITWVVAVASVFYFIYWWGTSTFDYFKKQGIPGPEPRPFVGTMWGLWKQNLPKYDKELVKKYGKTFGQFDGTLPNLFTTDAELIKKIFVKDFDHFVNRRNFRLSSRVVRKMVSTIENQEWKDVRSSITPAFTTGKIKRMSVMIQECADRLVVKFEKIAETQGKFDAKQEFGVFTMDVIARCAFGMTIENLGERGDPFMEKAKNVLTPPANKTPSFLLPFVFPSLMGMLSERFLFTEGFRFFISVLEDLVQKRSSSSEKYHDFVELATEAIMEYTKEVDGKRLPMWNREEVDEIVIAQSVVFFLAGFETTATTLTHTAFSLARNLQVQDKLYEEVMKKQEKFGEVSHDMVLDLPYVDHVIHEALRMYPPATRIERCCNKDISYDGVHIKKGTIVTVPSFALHYDEEYYPEPNRFNPDRWDSNSGIKPNPNTFMPFGMGPRNCIGMRFAMEEMKIALCTLVKNFRFFPVSETPEDLEFENGFNSIVIPLRATIGIALR